MKKSWLIIVGIVLLIAAATTYVMLTRGTTTETVGTPQPQTASDLPAAATEEPAKTTPGDYKTYDAAVVAQTSGRKILFFYAPWCPQCRELEQSIQSSTIPPNVTIFKTDFDSSTDLRQKYGVSLQTTLVEIDASGNKIQAYTAYSTPDLATVITEMKL